MSVNGLSMILASVTIAAGRQPQFKSGVEVVYLDVTVQAPDGSIVRGLAKDDFLIYDEEVPQDVAVFSAEPAPISGRVDAPFTAGQAVMIRTDGSGDAPATGRLAQCDPTGIVILREGERCGRVAVHFPRLGQIVLPG